MFGGVWISTKLGIMRWNGSKWNRREEMQIEPSFFPFFPSPGIPVVYVLVDFVWEDSL